MYDYNNDYNCNYYSHYNNYNRDQFVSPNYQKLPHKKTTIKDIAFFLFLVTTIVVVYLFFI